AQERLWFLDQLEPGNPAYNLSAAAKLSGHLAHGALARSLNEVVRRHEILRTTFRAIAGEPRQVVAAEAAVPMPLIDLSSLAEDRGGQEQERLIAAETSAPFDLSAGPLL